MAKQKGMYKLKGTIGDVSFYKTKYGYIAREKTEISAERIAKDPAFKRTRENGQEFGSIIRSGKLLRDAIAPLLSAASDNRTQNRITELMAALKRLDVTSPRGKRHVGVGINDPAAVSLLKGFQFNRNSILNSILSSPVALDTSTGEILIANLVPVNRLAAPFEATHVRFLGCVALVDFLAGTWETVYSNEVILPIDATSTDVLLTPPSVPTGSGTLFYLLHVSFIEQIGTDQYSLQNSSYNSLQLLDFQ